MDITLPILILAIPFLMFLILGIGGVKMSRKLAGVLGILGMGSVMTLSYVVALTYFFSGDAAFIVDGVRQQLQVFDVTWLAFTDRLVVNIGFLLDICHDAGGDHHHLFYGTPLQLGIHGA